MLGSKWFRDLQWFSDNTKQHHFTCNECWWPWPWPWHCDQSRRCECRRCQQGDAALQIHVTPLATWVKRERDQADFQLTCNYYILSLRAIIITTEVVNTSLPPVYFSSSLSATCHGASCICDFICVQSVSKHLQRWYRGRLPQTIVDSWYCLDRVVPEGIIQVSRRSEVGNHKRRSLNTRLSLALLRELSHVPRGLKENAEARQVRKTNRTDILYQIEKKLSKNRSSRFEPKILLISFSRGSVGPHWSRRVRKVWFP